MAKMGELKRAAELLGVTSTALRQHGWRSASLECVTAVLDNPPDWLIIARERHGDTCAKRQMRRVGQGIVERLDVTVGIVREREISLGDVDGLLAAPPEWWIIASRRRTAHREREQADAQRRAVGEAELEGSEGYLRAAEDGGDTDAWAAGVLPAAGTHRIDLGCGDTVPVLPPALKLVR
jgi:hypothetical protein